MERKNIDIIKISDERNHNNDDNSDDFKYDLPDIPGVPPHELPEVIEKIQKKRNSIENAKQVTSSSSDMSDDESKAESGADDDDFKDIDDSLFTNIENYISSISSLKKTLPNNQTTDEVEKKDDDLNCEIINNFPEEERSSKSPEATKQQLMHNDPKAHLQPITHSNLGPIQNKSPKIQPEHARYHPYEKKEVKISPQKSLVNSKELNTQCTVSNTATESNAALMPIKKEFLMSPDNKIDSTQMLQRGTTNDS
ncbi:uncharacterized protein LOC111036358 [Myzus persicae]|uniref:uncharacterized protein LOC111036358 n=1 Tax=Myzus persicae TaxID=13164 RepID=UPI000B934541|nr:uncharacterized protein LOC111036358 [Myzus persicae]